MKVVVEQAKLPAGRSLHVRSVGPSSTTFGDINIRRVSCVNHQHQTSQNHEAVQPRPSSVLNPKTHLAYLPPPITLPKCNTTNISHSCTRILSHASHTPQSHPFSFDRRRSGGLALQRPRIIMVGPPRPLAPPTPHEPPPPHLHHPMPLHGPAQHRCLIEHALPRYWLWRRNLRGIRGALAGHEIRHRDRSHARSLEDSRGA
jgi:hypothetical protein